MSVKLYVGNLNYSVTSNQLADLFAQYGDVEDAVVLNDRQTGRSRGFGFVTMADPEQAQEAIDKLNGQEFEGRNLIVNEARPRRDDR
ncbi:MAG: RNA-binding protein [bacterium]|nr:RNA-binding protein [bacterium]